MKYKQFFFESYNFDSKTGLLQLHYGFDNKLHFVETYRFDFDYADYDAQVLDLALQALFFMAGVSYYKMYIPHEIVVKSGQLDSKQAEFFSKTYQKGLGEFWYVNKLDPRTDVVFPTTTGDQKAGQARPSQAKAGQGLLVAVGGGKDSLVTIEALRGQEDAATWSLNHRPQLTPLVERIALPGLRGRKPGLPHYWVDREWDPQIIELNNRDALNGHVPISAIIACVGTVVAILSGRRDVVMSNEQSANEPTLYYQGVAINHQYSKSREFEQDYQRYLNHTLGARLRYYSFLRPLSEVRIAELFASHDFDKYKDVFSSCNRAFVHGSHQMSWCGECSKCAFIFLALTPFVPREKLEKLWGGKNLLLDPALESTYRKLLGIEGDKPLDCVGEVKESRAAMRLAFHKYPELKDKYHFDLPADYDYHTLAPHEMPTDIYELFKRAFLVAES